MTPDSHPVASQPAPPDRALRTIGRWLWHLFVLEAHEQRPLPGEGWWSRHRPGRRTATDDRSIVDRPSANEALRRLLGPSLERADARTGAWLTQAGHRVERKCRLEHLLNKGHRRHQVASHER